MKPQLSEMNGELAAFAQDKSPPASWPKGTQNVRRTLSILRTLAQEESGARLSQIAKTVSLPLPTAKRILSVMVLEGFAKIDPGSKRYSVGMQLYNLCQKEHYSQLKDAYHAILKNIAEKTEDTVQLVARSGLDTVCVDLVEGDRAVRIQYGIGSRLPLGLGISGAVLLALLPEDEIEAVLRANALRYSAYKVSLKYLRNQVKDIRQRGFNLRSESRLIEGIAGVAVPIMNHKNELVSSITVSSTSSRMTLTRCRRVAGIIKENIKVLSRLFHRIDSEKSLPQG